MDIGLISIISCALLLTTFYKVTFKIMPLAMICVKQLARIWKLFYVFHFG